MVIGVEGVCYFILFSWIIILPKLLDIIRRQHGDWKVTGAETGKGASRFEPTNCSECSAASIAEEEEGQ